MQTDMAVSTGEVAGAFSQLLHQHRRIVFKIAATYAWSPEDRADLAQDIATQLWAAFARYDRSRPFTTWMYRVALNTAMAHARAESIKRRHFPSDPGVLLEPAEDAADAAADAESLVLLAQVMSGLNQQSRALLLLHLEARSSHEIAEILGLSASNVTTRLSRLRQQLSMRLSST